MDTYPTLIAPVVDAVDAVGLAEFWRSLLGMEYRPGQGPDDDPTFIVVQDATGQPRLVVQRVAELARSTWPAPDVPAQLHLDMIVPSYDELQRHVARAVDGGATVLEDRSADDDDPLIVLADPAGHPFCLIVSGFTPPDADDQ